MRQPVQSPKPSPLLLLVVIAATAAPLLLLAAEEPAEKIEEIVVEGRLSRYSALKSDVPIMQTARSVSVEDRETAGSTSAIKSATPTGASRSACVSMT